MNINLTLLGRETVNICVVMFSLRYVFVYWISSTKVFVFSILLIEPVEDLVTLFYPLFSSDVGSLFRFFFTFLCQISSICVGWRSYWMWRFLHFVFSNLTWFLSLFFFSVIPNCQFRSKNSRLKTFTANQLDEIKDPSGLFYILPFQKVRLPLQVQCRLGNSFLLGAHVCAGLPGQLGCSEEGVGSPFWKGDV